jgi:hypothetical protein
MKNACAAGLLAFLALPSAPLSGAFGPAPWTRLEMTSPTTRGRVLYARKGAGE